MGWDSPLHKWGYKRSSWLTTFGQKGSALAGKRHALETGMCSTLETLPTTQLLPRAGRGAGAKVPCCDLLDCQSFSLGIQRHTAPLILLTDTQPCLRGLGVSKLAGLLFWEGVWASGGSACLPWALAGR